MPSEQDRWAEETSGGDQLRELTQRVENALSDAHPDPEVVRELMWRTAALKGRLFCNRDEALIPLTEGLQHRLAMAYEPARLPAADVRSAGRLGTTALGRSASIPLVEEVSLRLRLEATLPTPRKAPRELLCAR